VCALPGGMIAKDGYRVADQSRPVHADRDARSAWSHRPEHLNEYVRAGEGDTDHRKDHSRSTEPAHQHGLPPLHQQALARSRLTTRAATTSEPLESEPPPTPTH
jgi:hypothetical protein